MTWSEIKKAAEQAGVKDEDEVSSIHCQLHDGGKTFYIVRLGNYQKLVESFSERMSKEASGCTC